MTRQVELRRPGHVSFHRPSPLTLDASLNVNRFLALTLLAFLGFGIPAAAQQTDPSRLTVQRIYGSPEFAAQPFGPSRWLGDGSAYTTLEPAEGGGLDIVRYDVETDRREVMVAARQLVPPGADAPLDVEEYAWSPDGKKALIFTNTQPVWRLNTRGRLLGAGPRGRQAPQAGRREREALDPDVRQVLARRGARRLRAGEQPVRGGSRQRRHHRAHHRRLPHAHQRHLRLGVRRGADELLRRRLALEPGREQHRLLAAQRRLGEELPSDQLHRLALLQGHPDSVSEGGRDQLRRARRRRERRRRVGALAGDRGRSAEPLHRPDGLGGLVVRGHPPAAEPAAESRRGDAGRREDGEGADGPAGAGQHLGGRGGRRRLAGQRQELHLGERPRRVEPRLCRLPRREEGAAGHPGRLRRARGAGHRSQERLALLHRVAREPGPALPVPQPARRQGEAGAAEPGARVGHPRVRRRAELQVRHRDLLQPRQSPDHPPGAARRAPGRSARWSTTSSSGPG